MATKRAGSTPSAEDLIDRIEWYLKCALDVSAGVRVRGLAEARAGYESALAEIRVALGTEDSE